MPPIRSAVSAEARTFNLFLSCAQCIAPYFKLPDILALIKTSKICNETFTNSQIWLSICIVHKLKIEANPPVTNPYPQLHVCSPGLKVAAHWRFNNWETHNSNLFIDHSGNKDHLKVSTTPHPYVVDFSGKTFFAESLKTNTLNGRGAFTAEVILKPYQLGYGREFEFPILSKHAGGNGWEIRCSKSVITFMITPYPWNGHIEIVYNRVKLQDKKDKKKSKNEPINTDEPWMHIAGTFDGKNICLYVDGKLCASKTFPYKVAKLEECDRPFSIGFCQGWHDRCLFRGDIREVRICNTSLTPEQFLKL